MHIATYVQIKLGIARELKMMNIYFIFLSLQIHQILRRFKTVNKTLGYK